MKTWHKWSIYSALAAVMTFWIVVIFGQEDPVSPGTGRPLPILPPSATASSSPTPGPSPSPSPSAKVTKAPSPKAKVSTAPSPEDPVVYYASCADVRAAGKAPLHRGEPGYRSGLDRDHDGIACDT